MEASNRINWYLTVVPSALMQAYEIQRTMIASISVSVCWKSALVASRNFDVAAFVIRLFGPRGGPGHYAFATHTPHVTIVD
jgi:hypothetical protein